MPSVLADFTGYATVEPKDWERPTQVRILLNETQLVLAVNEEDKLVISLNQIFDITINSLPQVVDPMPGTPVTVAFTHEESRTTVVVSADEQTSEKFYTVLFKAILNGTYTTLKHPAKVGGRVLDTPFEAGILSLETSGVQFDTNEGPVRIPLDAVVDFSREKRAVDGEQRPVLVVSHISTGESLTSVAAIENPRKLSLLGRYLRQQYQPVIDSLRTLELTEQETEALTTIYSVGDMDVSLPSVLDTDPQTAKRILHSLHEKGLVESGAGAPVLTAKGQIVVNEYLERVNA